MEAIVRPDLLPSVPVNPSKLEVLHARFYLTFSSFEIIVDAKKESLGED